jgi:hypothetical protein
LTVSRFYFTLQIPTTTKRSSAKKIAIYNNHITHLLNSTAECANTLCDIPKMPFFYDLKLTSIEAQQQIMELRRILAIYEKVVTSFCTFPAGGEMDPLKIQRHVRATAVYGYYVRVDMLHGRFLNETIQDAIDRRYRLLEVLYRGTKHAFHSLELLRYISHTFFSLINLNGDNICDTEKMEAEAAIEAYLFHWEKVYAKIVDTKCKEFLNTQEFGDGKVSRNLYSRQTQLYK